MIDLSTNIANNVGPGQLKPADQDPHSFQDAYINSLHARYFHLIFCRLLLFSKINLFKKLFQKHFQSVKQFGSRSGLTFCRAWSGSKLFAKIISRQHQLAKSYIGKQDNG